MSSSAQRPMRYKTAWPLRLLAILFLVAPIGNLLMSFASSGVEAWYLPQNLLPMLMSVSILDWIWLGLVFLSGVLLLVQHKTSWIIAVHSLVLVLGINMSRFFGGDSESFREGFAHMQMLASIAATLAVLLVAFYFRFPYLDRRSGWLSWSETRYPLQTGIQLLSDDFIDGLTESLSLNGGLAILKKDAQDFFQKNESFKLLFPEINRETMNCRLIDYQDNQIRFQFENLTEEQSQSLQKFFQDRS